MKTFPAASAAELQQAAEAEAKAVGSRYSPQQQTHSLPSPSERPTMAQPISSMHDPNDLIIRLVQIESALTYITRNHGVLGLGANAVQQSLREEKDMIINKLKEFGEEKFPQLT